MLSDLDHGEALDLRQSQDVEEAVDELVRRLAQATSVVRVVLKKENIYWLVYPLLNLFCEMC